MIWRLANGSDRRVKAKHPWVFSNELSHSPKGIEPGQPITLQDHKGQFVAYGYGNPHSLIAFRALSFDSRESDITTDEGLLSRLKKIWAQRLHTGYKNSFRFVYGEGDFIPGLVVDRYLVKRGQGHAQVLAVQILTAGVEQIIQQPEKFFRKLVEDLFDTHMCPLGWAETAVVLRNDVQVRKLEGLEYQQPLVVKNVEGLELSDVGIILDGTLGYPEVVMNTDLIEGQKTGFFLDQAYNIDLLIQQIIKQKDQYKDGIRILDLCCYVGQWSTKISAVLKQLGINCEVTIVDVSEKALSFAKRNVEQYTSQVIVKRMDVMQELAGLPTRHWDVVIADPPAFIKAKKDIPTGRAGYLKLFTQALKLTQSGGLCICCSCSGLFREEDMIETLSKAAGRSEAWIRCLAKGGHAADHPVLMSFAEGFYLKGLVFQVIS